MAALSCMYRVSGFRPRLPTTITLFTDAISNLPSHQFTYPTLIPLSGHYLDARNALVRHDLSLAHSANPGKRFPQPVQIDSGCYRQRQTRKLVDFAPQGSHAGRDREP